MKKITFALLLALGFSKPASSQAVYAVQAPEYDGGSFSAYLGPAGTSTNNYQRGCYLITQAELTRMIATNSVITNFGFDFYRPASTSVTGQFTLYLQNTTDLTYNKGTAYPALLTGMSTNYTGNMTLTGSTAASTAAVSMALSNTFTWTGGGIYVAWDWYAATSTATAPARYLGNYDPTTPMGVHGSAGSAGPAPTTLVTDVTRPVMRFSAVNTATNEVGVTRLEAPGLVSKLMNPGHTVSAQIRNNSSVTLSNVPVTLGVSGANTFNNTQTVSSIAPGATANVVFTPFVPTANGLNNMTVTVAADQYTNNNSFAWTQTVTCSDYGNNPAFAASTFSSGSYGYGGQAIIATPFTPPSSCSLTTIKFASSSATAATSVCGVLIDGATGGIIAMTNTVNLTGANFGTFNNLKFTPPEILTGGTQYYLGVAQLVGSTFPFGTSSVPADYNLNLYFTVPIAGGSIGAAQNQMGYLGIQAVLGFTDTEISVSASKTVVCKQDGPASVTLTALSSGLDTYTWTPGTGLGNGSSAVVSPTVPGASGSVNYNVTGTDTQSGCKSTLTSITVSVSSCNALATNNSNGFNINVYPNPTANGKSTITGLVGTNVITVMNTLGQVVARFSVSEETTSIDLSNQPSGNYLVKITDSSNESRVVKVINQN